MPDRRTTAAALPEDDFEDTGPIPVPPGAQIIAMARALGRVEDACSRLPVVESKVDDCARKLEKCPLHAEALTKLTADIGQLQRRRPSEEIEKALDTRADRRAALVRRWLPVVIALFSGGAGMSMLKSCPANTQAELIRALREEQRESQQRNRAAVTQPDAARR